MVEIKTVVDLIQNLGLGDAGVKKSDAEKSIKDFTKILKKVNKEKKNLKNSEVLVNNTNLQLTAENPSINKKQNSKVLIQSVDKLADEILNSLLSKTSSKNSSLNVSSSKTSNSVIKLTNDAKASMLDTVEVNKEDSEESLKQAIVNEILKQVVGKSNDNTLKLNNDEFSSTDDSTLLNKSASVTLNLNGDESLINKLQRLMKDEPEKAESVLSLNTNELLTLIKNRLEKVTSDEALDSNSGSSSSQTVSEIINRARESHKGNEAFAVEKSYKSPVRRLDNTLNKGETSLNYNILNMDDNNQQDNINSNLGIKENKILNSLLSKTSSKDSPLNVSGSKTSNSVIELTNDAKTSMLDTVEVNKEDSEESLKQAIVNEILKQVVGKSNDNTLKLNNDEFSSTDDSTLLNKSASVTLNLNGDESLINKLQRLMGDEPEKAESVLSLNTNELLALIKNRLEKVTSDEALDSNSGSSSSQTVSEIINRARESNKGNQAFVVEKSYKSPVHRLDNASKKNEAALNYDVLDMGDNTQEADIHSEIKPRIDLADTKLIKSLDLSSEAKEINVKTKDLSQIVSISDNDSVKQTQSKNAAKSENRILEKILQSGNSDSNKNNMPYNNNLFMAKLNSMNGNERINSSSEVVVHKSSIIKDVIKTVEYMEVRDIKELTVKVNPKELGEIAIKVTMENGIMKANITAKNEETYHIINSNLPDLNAQLAEQNIKIQSFSVDIFNGQAANYGQSNEGYKQQGQHRRAQFLEDDESISNMPNLEDMDLYNNNLNILA